MRQRQLERLRRLQMRQFQATTKKLCAELAKFDECRCLIADLMQLKKQVEKIAASGAVLIAAAKSLPKDCVNSSEAVALSATGFGAHHDYVRCQREMPQFIFEMRLSPLSVWFALKTKVKQGESNATDEYVNELGWSLISMDSQVTALKQMAISIASLYEAQLRLLKVRLWMGNMGTQTVRRYEGDDPSGAMFAF
jgi:hypothetical protein